MAVSTDWGPPSIAGSIKELTGSIGGSIDDYRTGQMLQNLPRTADGSINYREAAAMMYRTNPALAAQFLKMEELKGLQDYRQQSLGIQQQHVDLARDKSGTTVVEGKSITRGPDGRITQVIDNETGQDITGTWGARGGGAPSQQPRSPVNAGVGKQPTDAHLQILQADPSKASMFDEVYGPGSAQRYLSGGGPADPRQQAPAPAAVPAAAPAAPAQAQPAVQLPQRYPGEGYDAFQARRKKFAEELGSVDNPELKKADDAIQSGRNTLLTIAEMQQLNKTAFDKPTAGIRGTIAAVTGIGGKQAGVDTGVLENKITGGALEQLRATFGGNPTEGERAILLKVQGSVNQVREIREQIFKDAAELVRRRIKYNQKYATAVRAGNQHLFPAYTDNLPVD